MSEYESITLTCSRPEFVSAVNEIISRLPPDLKDRFGDVFSSYLAGFRVQGAYERMNNRSVGQILAEFEDPQTKVIEEGERDGLRYKLYDAPPVKPAPPDNTK